MLDEAIEYLKSLQLQLQVLYKKKLIKANKKVIKVIIKSVERMTDLRPKMSDKNPKIREPITPPRATIAIKKLKKLSDSHST